jgi:hypothetical protein
MGHGVIPDGAGWGTFSWLILLFLFVTIVFALSLQIIIGRLRRVRKAIDGIFASASQGSMSAAKIPTAAFQIKRRRRNRGLQGTDLESTAE